MKFDELVNIINEEIICESRPELYANKIITNFKADSFNAMKDYNHAMVKLENRNGEIIAGNYSINVKTLNNYEKYCKDVKALLPKNEKLIKFADRALMNLKEIINNYNSQNGKGSFEIQHLSPTRRENTVRQPVYHGWGY